MANGRFLIYSTFGLAVAAVAGLGFWAGQKSEHTADKVIVEMTDVDADPIQQARDAIQPTPLAEGATVRLESTDREVLHAEIRNYLLEEPEIIMEAIRILEQRRVVDEAQAEIDMVKNHEDAIFNDGFSFVGGNPEGSVTMVEFLDYRCGYCKRAHGEVASLLQNDGDIRLIVKEYPILGPDSMAMSELAIATKISQGDDAYKRFADALMAFDGPLTDAAMDRVAKSASIDIAEARAALAKPEIKQQIAANHELGRTLNVSGTPTFIIGNKFVRGYLPLAQMAEAVELSRRVQN